MFWQAEEDQLGATNVEREAAHVGLTEVHQPVDMRRKQVNLT